MPRPKKRKQQLKQLVREKKRRKQEEEKHAPEETHHKRVRNIGLDSVDEEEEEYTFLLLDEFGKAMEDVFEIFQNGLSEDDGQDPEHRTVTYKAAIDIERPKKPSNRLDEALRTKQRRSPCPNS
jgi:hypothetical protein